MLRFLRERPDVIAAEAGDATIRVSLLGSRTEEANAAELELRLTGWRAANVDGAAWVELPDASLPN